MPIFARASREYEFVPGQGASVEVQGYDGFGNLTGGIITLDIHEGIVVETYRNENTTNSGSNGADDYTRVGAGWTFALVTSFPALAMGARLDLPFVQQILGSSRGIAMKFNIGDPEYWQLAFPGGLDPRSYRASKALLGEVTTRIDSRNIRAIGLNMAGVGKSLLGGFLGNAIQYPAAEA